MADEIDKSPKAVALVKLIYTLDAEIAAAKAKLDAAKLDLILLNAPQALADKVRTNVELKEAELVELGAKCSGKYADAEDRICTVVIPKEPGPTYDLYPDAEYKKWLEENGHNKKGSVKLEREWRKLREDKARELTGKHFAVLFDHFNTYEPVKKVFVEMAPRLLTEAKSRDIIALCKVTKAVASPSVKLESRPKEEK